MVKGRDVSLQQGLVGDIFCNECKHVFHLEENVSVSTLK